MKILLDTHIALWSVVDSSKLTRQMREIIESDDSKIYYSIISVWEILLKHKAHPDQMEVSARRFELLCKEAMFYKLGLYSEHIYAVDNLIWSGTDKEHKDPFDRILLAQAMAEEMKFMTSDRKISGFVQNSVILV